MDNEVREITVKDVEGLGEGDILSVGRFKIQRVSETMSILGVPTKMYSVNRYEIIDMFGYVVDDGDAEYVSGFMNGLNGFCDDLE